MLFNKIQNMQYISKEQQPRPIFLKPVANISILTLNNFKSNPKHSSVRDKLKFLQAMHSKQD